MDSFKNEFSLPLIGNCASVSIAPSVLFSAAPSLSLSEMPSLAPSGSNVPSTFPSSSSSPSLLSSLEPTITPTNESPEKNEFIDIDNFGRRYFPKQISSLPTYVYPIIPDCTKHMGLAGCVVLPSHREGPVPEWAGKIHAAPPICENESCQLGLPQSPSELMSNSSLSPMAESKYFESGVSSIVGGSSETYAMAIADVDNDGWLDMVVGNYGMQPNLLVLNDQSRRFDDEERARELPGIQSNTACVAIAHLNNDTFLDIIFGNDGQPNLVLLSDSSGWFEATELAGGNRTSAVVVADANDDGWLDIIFTNKNEANQVLFNDGNGGFENDENSIEVLPGGSLDTTSVAAADMNNDGWVDLIFGNFGDHIQLLWNDGAGNFVLDRAFKLPRGNTNAIAAADVNNDGWVDIIVGRESQRNQLLLSKGHAVNAPVLHDIEKIDLPGGALKTKSIAVADLNNDGWIDVVVAHTDNNINQLLLNKGIEGHTRYSLFDVALELPGGKSKSLSISVADMDKDGLNDVVVGNQDTSNQLLLNFRLLVLLVKQ